MLFLERYRVEALEAICCWQPASEPSPLLARWEALRVRSMQKMIARPLGMSVSVLSACSMIP